MDHLFPPPAPVSVAVEGSAARLPVRRIFCVGRNYAEHAREFGNDPDREPPFFFTKPADALVESGGAVPYPAATQDFHYEAELVVALGRGGAFVTEAEAAGMILGHAAGNDLTRRDLQAEAKAMRRPWDMAKGFDASAVIAPIRRGPLPDGAIRGVLNGRIVQEARLSDMIWPVTSVIAFLSLLVELRPGDLIFTGTPAGVGPMQRGDRFETQIDGLAPAVMTVG